MQVQWKGICLAITTKFTADDRLDLKTFGKNINAQLEAGVHGIILGGSLGEASSLEEEEKFELVSTCLQLVQGKIPVVLNVAEQTTKAAIRMAEQAQKSGANGLMLLPPMRYKATDHETVTYFKNIAAATDLPIIIYNNPIDYKIEVTLDMFEELAAYPTIQAVKESSRQISNVTKMYNRFGDRFRVIAGVDTLVMESLLMGADGWVAGLVCAFPRETVAIYCLIKAGRYQEAIDIYRWFLPILELDVSPQLVQNIKLAEVYTGLGTENMRRPRLSLASAERKRMQKILEDGLANRPALPDYLAAEVPA